MDFKEFDNEIRKRVGKGRKKVKVTNSWGVYDSYKHVRKNHWYNIGRPMKEGEYYAIIRNINKRLAHELALGHEVQFPKLMGRLELRKHEHGVSIVDGKLRNTYPLDWAATYRLWYEDEEERKKKTLVRRNEPIVYHVKYNKFPARYKNMCYYQFQVNRFIRQELKDNIKKGLTDTLW